MSCIACGYFWVSAGPTAVSAQCRHSACLLTLDVRTHYSIALVTTLVTRPRAHPVPAVCSGISLCAWHSTSVSVDSPTLLVPSTRQATLCDRAFPVAATWAWNSLPAQTRTASSLITFQRQTKCSSFPSVIRLMEVYHFTFSRWKMKPEHVFLF